MEIVQIVRKTLSGYSNRVRRTAAGIIALYGDGNNIQSTTSSRNSYSRGVMNSDVDGKSLKGRIKDEKY